MARPPKDINPRQVERLASINCTMEEIAYTLNCSVDTLERRFADVIEKGRAKGRMSLRRKQYAEAEKGNTTMLVWLGKQLLGQSDKQDINLNITVPDIPVHTLPDDKVDEYINQLEHQLTTTK